MTVEEDVFKFVAVRDPQLPKSDQGFRARAFEPEKYSDFAKALLGVPTTDRARLAANRLVTKVAKGEPPFLNRSSLVTEPFLKLDEYFRSVGDLPDIEVLTRMANELWPQEAQVEGGNENLADRSATADEPSPLPPPPDPVEQRSVRLGDVLKRDTAQGDWLECADNFLAVTFATGPPIEERATLGRALLIWEVLKQLSTGQHDPRDTPDLLRSGFIGVPGELARGAGTRQATDQGVARSLSQQATGLFKSGYEKFSRVLPSNAQLSFAIENIGYRSLSPLNAPSRRASPARLRSALAAHEDLQLVLMEAAKWEPMNPQEMNEPNEDTETPRGWTQEGFVGDEGPTAEVLGRLQPDTRAFLENSGLLARTDSLPGLVSLLAEVAREETKSGLDTSDLRTAIAAENWRRWGPPLKIPPKRTASLSEAMLLSPPVIGDLRLVRQTLRGYSRAEIAHIEPVLERELKRRRLTVVDLQEDEVTEVDLEEQSHRLDSRTAERSELSHEMARSYSATENMNVSGSLSAHGPFVEVSATAGYARSTAKTESINSGRRFAKELTQSAVDEIRQRREVTQRRLVRRTRTEVNHHEIDNRESGLRISGVYFWLDKNYCAQVYEYGSRVLLEVGVSDPSANYRYALARGSDLDVGVDPPPTLTSPGSSEMLTADDINEVTWATLAARFRAPDVPMPPVRFLPVTATFTSGDVSAEPASVEEGKSASSPRPSPPTYELNKELVIPAGYEPVRVVAVVLSGGAPARWSKLDITGNEYWYLLNIVRAAADTDLQVSADLAEELMQAWMKWAVGDTPLIAIRGDALRIGPKFLQLLEIKGVGSGICNSVAEFLRHHDGIERRWIDVAIGPLRLEVPLGGEAVSGYFNLGKPTPPADITAAGPKDLALPIVAGASAGGITFGLTVTVLCRVSNPALQEWRVRAFESILAAHADWETEFRAAVANATGRRGVTISGRNPAENARLIRTELKQAVRAALGGPAPNDLVAVDPGDPVGRGGRGEPPTTDRYIARTVGRLVRFFDRAFEWERMDFIFSDYGWTGRDDWPEAALRTDPDPAMQEFLRAGYARVLLPIKPDFEAIVASRLALTLPEPFSATPAPVPEGPWLSIADEIRARDDNTDGLPAGQPWPVTLPTTLVALEGTQLPRNRTACDVDAEVIGSGTDVAEPDTEESEPVP